MKIGVGVSTFRRPAHFKLWLEQYDKYKSDDMVLHSAVGIPNIAHAKNDCLRALKDCDYIFLFDDDCFPINNGWAEYFINKHLETGFHHFLYLKPTGTIKHLLYSHGVDSYDNCGGCFMFLTKEAVEKVGGYNTEYLRYGYEHAGLSQRIHKAGLNRWIYPSPAQAGDYIYALDYDNHLPFNKEVNHAPSLTLQEISESLDHNRANFFKDIQTVYQPF